jgi:hypothetical protein
VYNAARFVLMNVEGVPVRMDASLLDAADIWNCTVEFRDREVTNNLDALMLELAAQRYTTSFVGNSATGISKWQSRVYMATMKPQNACARCFIKALGDS